MKRIENMTQHRCIICGRIKRDDESTTSVCPVCRSNNGACQVDIPSKKQINKLQKNNPQYNYGEAYYEADKIISNQWWSD